MGLHTQLEDLTVWKPKSLSVNKAHPKQLFKIITSEEQGIILPIVTSYLISSERVDVHRFLRYRLKVLLGTQEFPTENERNKMRDTVLLYNPFSYIKRPIFSKRLEKKVFQKIKDFLNSHFEHTHDNCENSDISKILTAASSMLECTIFLYQTNRYNYKSVECYNVNHSKRELHIFSEEKITSSFGYGITKDDALHFRQIALNQIIRRLIRLDSMFFKFKEEIYMENHFLISVVQGSERLCKRLCCYLKEIFNFPRKVLTLIEAGFSMNPFETDENGLSSFFYAVEKEDASLVASLYYYATNNCCFTETTCGKQETDISTTLKSIKRTLETDKSVSENFSSLENRETAIQFYLQLMHLHDCQFKTINDVTKNEKSNSNDIVKNEQVIIALIEKFRDYFYFGEVKDSPMEKYKNYLDFNVYYDIFDNYFSFLFFENILSLAPILNDTIKSIYFDFISSLFLLIQSKDKYPIIFKGSNINYEENFTRYISLCYRENILEKALKLKVHLENVNVNNAIGSNKTEDVVKSFLIHQPDISDAMTAFRLKYYLSFERSYNKEMLKKMLVTKRALQVLDELIQDEDVTKSPMKLFLCSCLQDDSEPKLTFICNFLSRYKLNSIQDHLHLENNTKLHKELQNEFEILSEIFNSIEFMQLHKVEEIMIEKGIDKAKKSFRIALNSLEEKKNLVFKERKKSYKNKVSNFVLLVKNMLNYIKGAFDKKKIPRKAEIVNNRITALVHLLQYMVNCTEDIERDILQRELESFRNVLSQMKVGDSVSQHEMTILSLLSKSSNTLSELFRTCEKTFKFCPKPIAKELSNEHHNYDIFSEAEGNIFKEKITLHLEKSRKLKELCLKYLDTDKADRYFKNDLEQIIMTEKNRRLIKVFYENSMFEEVKKRLKEIKDLTPDCIFKAERHTTDTILSMSTKDDERFLLLKVYFKLSMRKKIHQLLNQRIYFLINRIDKLKSILIDEDKIISYLWNRRNKNEHAKQRVKTLICQRYFCEHSTRAAVEILLFDCMNVCGDENRDLWIEANNLFTGMHFKSNLMQFYPFVQRNVANNRENVSTPRNFTLASIDYIVDLIDDKEVLVALLQLWIMKRKCTLLTFINSIKIGNNYQILDINQMKDQQLQRKYQLEKLVRSSKRWERYAKMLPLER